MGEEHGHVTGQGATGAFEEKGKPGLLGVRPETPEAHLRDFREFPRILRRRWPAEVEFLLATQEEDLSQGQGGERRQGREIEGRDLGGADRHRRGWVGHQEL
jgi:hypothetical protein